MLQPKSIKNSLTLIFLITYNYLIFKYILIRW